jgi:hypothetical protein
MRAIRAACVARMPDDPAEFEVSPELPPRRAPGGFADPQQIGRSASGRPLCRRCAGEIPKGSGRRTFCSESCVVEWKVRTQPGFAAELLFERDLGVCALCRRDCAALQRKVRICRWRVRRRRMKELGLPAYLLKRRRYWEVDHIVPVVEGGGSCGLDNLRTLCWECHRKATRELLQRRSRIKAA